MKAGKKIPDYFEGWCGGVCRVFFELGNWRGLTDKKGLQAFDLLLKRVEKRQASRLAQLLYSD